MELFDADWDSIEKSNDRGTATLALSAPSGDKIGDVEGHGPGS
jgi:hypothetical protein